MTLLIRPTPRDLLGMAPPVTARHAARAVGGTSLACSPTLDDLSAGAAATSATCTNDRVRVIGTAARATQVPSVMLRR